MEIPRSLAGLKPGAIYSHHGAVLTITAMFLVDAWITVSGRSWKRLKRLAIAAFILLASCITGIPLLLFKRISGSIRIWTAWQLVSTCMDYRSCRSGCSHPDFDKACFW